MFAINKRLTYTHVSIGKECVIYFCLFWLQQFLTAVDEQHVIGNLVVHNGLVELHSLELYTSVPM